MCLQYVLKDNKILILLAKNMKYDKLRKKVIMTEFKLGSIVM